jgi:hypothetical protein
MMALKIILAQAVTLALLLPILIIGKRSDDDGQNIWH